MSDYDFKSLNDKEFEALVVDVLSHEFQVRAERFKPGKDKGVDGRWHTLNREKNDEVIVQCKHWIESDFKALRRHLKRIEKQKMIALNPHRYLLVVSLPLSRENKRDIAELFQPVKLAEADIWGREDLNDALRRFRNIETSHYKLWLSSSTVLATLLNRATVGRSKAELEAIRHEATIYVKTREHKLASQRLKKNRTLLITGAPGIGKTTLARQLALELVARGSTLVVIEEDISEAEDVFQEGEKQVFYFDDFLGRTYLEALKTKQDSHTTRFIARVANDSSKRFILTSRTNILSQGERLSDLYRGSEYIRSRLEMKIDDVRTIDRARILYNHIWHCSLSEAYVDELYRDKRYRKLILHPNFNPRLIAFVVDHSRIRTIGPTKYWDYVEKTFEKPDELWEHFFTGQLSQDERDLAYLAVLNGRSIRESDLEAGFLALRAFETPNVGHAVHRFRTALKNTVESVLVRTISTKNNSAASLSLYNPSIADYVLRQLADSEHLWQYYWQVLRTRSALRQLEQLAREAFFGRRNFLAVALVLARQESTPTSTFDAYGLSLTCLLIANADSESATTAMISLWINRSIRFESSLDPADYLRVFSAASKRGFSAVSDRALELAEFFENTHVPIDEPELIAATAAIVQRTVGTSAANEFESIVLASLEENIKAEVKEAGVLGGFYDLDDTSDAESAVARFLGDRLSELGIADVDAHISSLTWKVDIDAAIQDNRAASYQEEESEYHWNEQDSGTRDLMEQIDDLFDRSN